MSTGTETGEGSEADAVISLRHSEAGVRPIQAAAIGYMAAG